MTGYAITDEALPGGRRRQWIVLPGHGDAYLLAPEFRAGAAHRGVCVETTRNGKWSTADWVITLAVGARLAEITRDLHSVYFPGAMSWTDVASALDRPPEDAVRISAAFPAGHKLRDRIDALVAASAWAAGTA